MGLRFVAPSSPFSQELTVARFLIYWISNNICYILIALFVTKWIHGLETRHDMANNPLDPAEIENLQNFQTLIAEVETDYERVGSLAADVANVWACFLDDTWVWGITPRMGRLLRLLSRAYSEDWKKHNDNGSESMDGFFDGS
jgi:hypothetical protein